MPFNWKPDIREQDVNTLLLLEELHYRYLPHMGLEEKLAPIFAAYPHIPWFIARKTPEVSAWADRVTSRGKSLPIPCDLPSLIGDVMESIEDWIIYVTTPEDYHRQVFVSWDERELTELTDYTGKTVVDVGSGTGKQAFAVAPLAETVFCVEPVSHLRHYLKDRARQEKVSNLFVVEGVIEEIPFPDDFCDIAMCGHVVGDDIPREIAELERITRPGGMVILCPGNIDADNNNHRQLLSLGYQFSVFLEPGDAFGSGYKRKYWKTLP